MSDCDLYTRLSMNVVEIPSVIHRTLEKSFTQQQHPIIDPMPNGGSIEMLLNFSLVGNTQ